MLEVRYCYNCAMSKSAAEFYPSVKTECRDCRKAKAAPHRERKLKYLTEWRKANPDAATRWYRQNQERKAAYNATWYATNREAERRRYDAWAAQNKDKVNALIAKRVARKLQATVSWGNEAAIESFYAAALHLSAETGIKHEVDHIVPLQGKTVCGLHWEGNLRVIQKIENIRKSNKSWEGMPT